MQKEKGAAPLPPSLLGTPSPGAGGWRSFLPAKTAREKKAREIIGIQSWLNDDFKIFNPLGHLGGLVT